MKIICIRITLIITLTLKVKNFLHFHHIHDYFHYKENKTFVIHQDCREEQSEFHQHILPLLTLFRVAEFHDKDLQNFAK